MNRPNELIKEVSNFNQSMYGLELSSSECKELASYISSLEKALDKACEHLSYTTYYDVAIKKEVSTKEEWKEFLLGEKE